jgi:hypothetical protein
MSITYYQHNRTERDIVAVFEHTEPYGIAFGKPTSPAIFFEPTRLTFSEPRVFCSFICYHPVAREVAAAHYPDHVRWVELLIAAVQPPPLPVPAPDLSWPDIASPSFHLQETGTVAQTLITLTSSTGQQMTTLATESQLIDLWRQIREAILALERERVAFFLVDSGGDQSHLIPRSKRKNRRPRLRCNRLPSLPFRIFPLVAHPWAVGGVCFDCRKAYERLTNSEQEGSAS